MEDSGQSTGCSAPASGYAGKSVRCSCVVLQKQESSYDSFVAQRDSMLVLLRPNQAQLTLADTADAGASMDLPRPPWRDKIKFSHRTIHFLLPWLKKFHHEQMQEKIVEATIKGIDACEVKVPQANCAKNERIFCNNCRTSIVDFHRSCTKCSYDLCLICCRELRLGRCPGGGAASNTVLTQPEVEGKEDLQQTSSDDNSEQSQQQQSAIGTVAPVDGKNYNYNHPATHVSQGYADSTYSQ
ncbi:hypothetical protein ZWY2020_047920 [Hordeum vulgare]|nr:hypothetical protein ZWY2020_047920 [Hordeum vulgare]